MGCLAVAAFIRADAAVQWLLIGGLAVHAINIVLAKGNINRVRPHLKLFSRRAAAKGCGGVERAGGIGQHKLRAQVFKGFGLAGGGAAGTAHKALDGLGVGHTGGCRAGGTGGSNRRCAGEGGGWGRFGHDGRL